MPDLAEKEKLRRAVSDISSRAETAISVWGPQLRDRATSRSGHAPNAAADRIVAEEKLRQQWAEIESETTLVEREYEAKTATTLYWEERAAIAMRHSDDVTAQEAFQAHARHTEELHELVNELSILRKLAKACREVLAAPRD